jgi:hypothetical protein
LWPDSDLRIQELLEYVKYFEYGDDYLGTAEWVRYFAESLTGTKTVRALELEFEELVKCFQSEFEKGDPSRAILYSVVRTAFLASLSSPEKRERVLVTLPMFEEAVENSKNTVPILQAFIRYKDDTKMRYYGICLYYLFNSEGIFDVATRIIYALGLVAVEQEIPANLSELKWWKLKQKLADMNIPAEVIYEGWVNGRIRNAIAHSRFSYDDGTKKMRFRDVQTRYQPAYDQSFTIFEFSKLAIKLDNPFHLILNLLYILRIMDLIFTQDVKDVGKKSIFKKWENVGLERIFE